MYEHLGTWRTTLDGDRAFLDLWDTGRTREGKSELRWRLIVQTFVGTSGGAVIEGEDFWPSPLQAIDSDATAGALIGFLAHYGETSDEDIPVTAYERETLASYHEALGLWAHELEEGDE